ncbi:hypothetical protein FDZ71_03360, partial [bacterium]
MKIKRALAFSLAVFVSFPSLSPSLAMGLAEERQLGRRASAAVERQYRACEDPALEEYLNSLARKLTTALG